MHYWQARLVEGEHHEAAGPFPTTIRHV